MSRFRRVPCCLALVAFPVFCFAQSKNLLDVGGALSGKVLLAGEQRAAAEARVELKLMSGNWTASTCTNHDGEFTFAGLRFGTYLVTATAPECAPIEEQIQVDSRSAPLLLQLRRNVSLAGGSAAMVSVRELSIPEKARKAFHKGIQHLAARDSAGSVPEFRRAIAAFPDYYEAYYKLGIAELDLQQANDAETAFRKSIELSEGRYAPPHSGLSLMLCIEKRLGEAESLARAGVELDPTDATGHFALASVLYTTSRLPEAERCARQALVSKPDFAEAYLLLAEIHLRQSNASAVVEDLDAYLKLDPDSPGSVRARSVREDAQRALLQRDANAVVAAANP
jgi:tetratricopeptide (TPR) repeat protein